MTADASDNAGHPQPESSLLTALADLKQTPAGALIYEHVARLLGEQAATQSAIERSYAMLLRLLLDAYMRNPSLEQVQEMNAKFAELQKMFTSPSTKTLPAAALHLAEPSVSVPLAVAKPEPTASLKSIFKSGTQERVVDSAYRLHLERKRNEFEKLEKEFAQNIHRAITQNRELGALLKTEMNALQQTENEQELATMREILVGALDELIQGQRSLDNTLHQTREYLQLIKSDSDRLHEELNKVRLLSLTDEFTGLPNRRAFMRRLQDEMGRAERYGTPLAVALLDLDGFKAVNDRYGHAAGDDVLRAYAINVLSVLRHHDLVARYGGEEFAVLLANTTLEGAQTAIEKVRSRARLITCNLGGDNVRVPMFSAGLTLYLPGEPYAAIIERADRALYRAKHLGRNRTEVELPPDQATNMANGSDGLV